MLAALVVLGAVACTENEENLGLAPEQGLSFEATIDLEETRADVVFNEESGKWNTVWTGNETLTVVKGFSAYEFKNSAENKNLFVCANDGAKDLVGQNVTIKLTHDADYNTLNSKAGKAGGHIEATVESFDPTQTINLEAKSAFLRYSSAYEVTLDASSYIFDYNGQVRNTITLPAGEDVWVAVKAADKVTLSYSINGEKCKEKVINIAAKKIYNLGELGLPYETSAYSVVGTHNGWNAGATPMYIVGDFCVAYGVKFEAASNVFKVLGNDKWLGAASLTIGTWTSLGVDTADISIAAGTYDMYFSEARTMLCVVNAGAAAPELAEIEWALAGDFNSWGNTIMAKTEVANLFAAKGVELATGTAIKVKDAATWDTSFGGGITNLEPNKWMTVYSNGADINIAKSGKYDVYFQYGTTPKLYLVEADGDYTAATEQTVEGKEPEVTAKVVYLKPNSNWTQSNARFAAYFWNDGGSVWVSMTASDTTGIYEVHLPEGYDYGCNVIFARMNPSTTANNWNNKWNQTADLTTPTDGKNMYTVKENTWNNGGGTWSVK